MNEVKYYMNFVNVLIVRYEVACFDIIAVCEQSEKSVLNNCSL